MYATCIPLICTLQIGHVHNLSLIRHLKKHMASKHDTCLQNILRVGCSIFVNKIGSIKLINSLPIINSSSSLSSSVVESIY